MIKLQDAELISVLPQYIKENTDIQAISYAFKMGMEKLLQYAKISTLYGAVDTLPEPLINLMALELQSQYYEESLDLKVKREIVKNSLAWYSKSGTVSAVEELIEVVFGKGKLEEWVQFGGRPGTFRIKLDMGNDDAPIDIQDVLKKIKRYKKLSAHFDAIVIGYYFYVTIRYANAIRIQMNFYPRFNLPTLYLDGTWTLDGGRQLSGSDGYGVIDLYPIHIRIQSSIRAAPNGSIQVNFKYAAREEIGNAPKVLIRAPTIGRPKIRESITVPMAFRQETAAGGITIRNENRLDGTWKLDGRRKLNGGSESR